MRNPLVTTMDTVIVLDNTGIKIELDTGKATEVLLSILRSLIEDEDENVFQTILYLEGRQKPLT